MILGVAVFATSLPGETLHELESLGASCFPVDVTSAESVRALKGALVDRIGDELDVLINCAYVFSSVKRKCLAREY